MRKRALYPLLAGLLALCLTACGPVSEMPSPSPSPTAPPEASAPVSSEPVTPTEEPSLPPDTPEPVPEPVLEGSLPDREYQPWQEGYMEFLSRLCLADVSADDGAYQGLVEDRRGEMQHGGYEQDFFMEMGSGTYSLYDVDQDGVPELFVKYGICEADYVTQCYAFQEGRVVCIGEFPSGHSVLYTCPDKSAFLRHQGHMGYAQLFEYAMEDGVLTQEREIFNEDDVWSYTDPGEIVPGADWIETYHTQRGERIRLWTGEQPSLSSGKALLLPVCDWYDGPAATGNSSETARTAILAALNGEQPFYGASGDHFYGDVGWTTWEEYVQPEAAYPYNKIPFQIKSHTWLDINGDGQEECVLLLEAARNEESWPDNGTVVLSEQDGTVYAYFFWFYVETEFCADGTINGTRLSFWQDQCYEYAVQPGTAAAPAKWLDGPPVG